MKLLKSVSIFLSLLLAHFLHWIKAFPFESDIFTWLQQGSMRTHIKTKSFVFHLDNDAFVTSNILFADNYLLMTTDGKSTDLIVGSTDGYAEGVSAQAKFTSITGFLQINSSHVLLVDCSNSCLRFVNRITNLTNPFVGACESSGFRDGRYNDALFNYPWFVIKDLINPGGAIITELGNHALRSVNLDTGAVRTIINELPDEPRVVAFDLDKENIFITFPHFLGKLSVKTLAFTPLTPITNRGELDGDFSKASFGYPNGMLCMNKICLVADFAINKLRIVDVNKQRVKSICTGSDASVDGATTNCSLSGPCSLLLRSDTLFIGEIGAIRTIRKINACTSSPCRNSGTCTEFHNNLTCSCAAGWTGFICEIELEACQNRPCLNSGECSAGDNNTYTCTCRHGWTGKRCQTDINACTAGSCKNSVGRIAIKIGFISFCILISMIC